MRGILLINRRAVRARLQAVAAVLHVFVTAIFGRDGLGTVAAWAWPVDRTNDSLHAIIPLVLAAIGVAFALINPTITQRIPADSNVQVHDSSAPDLIVRRSANSSVAESVDRFPGRSLLPCVQRGFASRNLYP